MAQQPSPTIENHFIAGLKTEFTGLNFPENAATDAQNVVFSYIGDAQRRGGINYETNFVKSNIDINNVARSSFRWLNAGGDGQTQVLVYQIGATLYFYQSSNATTTTPLSTTLLSSNVNLLSFLPTGSTVNPVIQECQYTAGNGYLFVFHPNLEPFYCTFVAGVITANQITLQQRDLVGISEPGVSDTQRPTTLSNEHLYNLINQGWTQGANWTATGSFFGNVASPAAGTSITIQLVTQVNTTAISPGSQIKVVLNPMSQTGSNNNNNTGTLTIVGSVTSYQIPFTSVTLSIISAISSVGSLTTSGAWSGGNFTQTTASAQLTLVNVGFITAWVTALKNYPSNSDVWWLYKDTTNAFNPSGTFGNVQQPVSPAPKGTFILNVFNQDRSNASQIGGLTPITTNARPSTGAFYASRVFYAGVNASQQAAGDEPFTTWTENIYFSQIIESPTNFPRCYQANDPTSQNLFSLLPSDGGVITIPGCGAIYKLFSLRFGLLVFAANGIWFISGSSGIGFTANDFTVTKISSIRAISGTSFIDVQGYPMFWNEEGIYIVSPSAQPGSAHSPDIQLDVNNLCIGTILSYYDNIPITSKAFARGDYDYLNFIVQWTFRSTVETGIGNRYSFDTILSFNTVTKAFYPYTLPAANSFVRDIKYMISPGGITAPPPTLKYILGITGGSVTFAEENDFTNYVDFISENTIGYNFTSFFVTGYKLPGQGLRKIQVPYVFMFSRNPGNNSYGIRAIWDYAGSPTLGQIDAKSGKWSTRQIITNSTTDFTMIYRKIRLRGRGLAVQIRVDSQPGLPFDIMGWSVWNEVNTGI